MCMDNTYNPNMRLLPSGCIFSKLVAFIYFNSVLRLREIFETTSCTFSPAVVTTFQKSAFTLRISNIYSHPEWRLGQPSLMSVCSFLNGCRLTWPQFCRCLKNNIWRSQLSITGQILFNSTFSCWSLQTSGASEYLAWEFLQKQNPFLWPLLIPVPCTIPGTLQPFSK